ncbi:disease resistance protein RPV1-like [Cryptomeria japonica]|uniref:disease resistance protein RPV1-like n=1 Tax=Cryptomeria japonica TaxID=3369 RepID=UPI0027DA1FCE|nr:disease resistance protein RPV1-like [Cryptomeria japonica]
MGGIGKTTVAKTVYNQIYASFEAASFVFNVRATAAEVTGLTNLQKKILEDLAKYDGKIDSVDKGISLFKDRLGGKRVLLILDDVDSLDQLNALVGDWLAPGSRVVITSRDKHILNIAECIDKMTGLEINEGLQLFSWHAFLRASPSPSYKDLSEKIVEACKGHPLSLEVIGSSLYDKQNDTGCWTDALRNITLNPRIHKRLYISYRDLTDAEKEIFVDIACFFIGEHKTLPIVFWKSLYEMVDTAVLNLAMKLLIKIDDNGVFEMHDHLRDMGWTIAKTEKKGTRLWNAANLSTISNYINLSRLRLNGGNPQQLGIEGTQQRNAANLSTASNNINFSCPWVNEENPQTLKRLYRPCLRYLHLQDLPIEGMAEDTLATLPPSLIWLRLKNCSIEIGKLQKILAALRKPFQSGFVGNIGQLKIVQVDDKHFLDNLSVSSFFTLPNIQLVQHLELNWFENLKKLPDATGNLLQLQHLELRGCRSLKNFPDAIGNLSQLQHLNLERCWSLKNLPDSIGSLTHLQHLNFEGCKSLNKLPQTIGNLSRLQYLNLEKCWSLKKLPCTIGDLSKLQHLNLSWCISLKTIPYTIGNMSQLQHLSLERCWSLTSLPYTIGDLSELQYLNLSSCITLQTFPHTIGNLSQLQRLNFYNCKRLNSIPDTIGNLSQLQYLKWKNGRIWKYRNTN